MVIHFHFHRRATGVTRSIETIFPLLKRSTDVCVFGYGINLHTISIFSLLKFVFSTKGLVIHTHRNNEIIFALLLRLVGGKFTLVFTRHAEKSPSGFTFFLMKRAEHLVTLSKRMSEKLELRNTLIRHGVNTDVFNIGEKKSLKNITQKNLVTVIGRIRPEKGQLTVLEAMAPILQNKKEWGLLLIGKTDNKKYISRAVSLASEKGISPQVHIIPECSDIINYYHASSIVVISSLSEGFSLVCLEAMSCGLITIATESVGIHSEVIRHGENGFLFQKNDAESLNSILSDIIDNKIPLNPEKVRKSITDNWSVERQVGELLKLYGSQHV